MGDALVDILFPRVCHICGAPLPPGEEFLCLPCRAALPRTNYHRLSPNKIEGRLASVASLARATSWLHYTRDSAPALLIHDMKYRRFPRLGTLLGQLMATELFSTGFFSDIDIISPVPLHLLKKMKRGYNQTEMIARGVADITGLPVKEIFKARRHRSQTSMSHAQRLLNTKGIFSLRDPSALAGRHILIIDDVCTTGATLSSLGSLLDPVPGARVSFLTLAAPAGT